MIEYRHHIGCVRKGLKNLSLNDIQLVLTQKTGVFWGGDTRLTQKSPNFKRKNNRCTINNNLLQASQVANMSPVQASTQLSGFIRLCAVPKPNLTHGSPDKRRFVEVKIMLRQRSQERHSNIEKRRPPQGRVFFCFWNNDSLEHYYATLGEEAEQEGV